MVMHAAGEIRTVGARRCLGQVGALITEMVVAIAILAVVVMPMAYAFQQEMKLCRSYYYDALAMELVDGEMEILAAGEWRAFQPGVQPYPVNTKAATNLPPGRFTLALSNQVIRLEWRPAQKGHGRVMVREARVQ
jgi:hypothetical protein